MISLKHRDELPQVVANELDQILASLKVFLSVAHNNDGTVKVTAGSILATGSALAPSGYLVCDGSAVSRTAYAILFAVIGVTYGVGNGTTTFNIPNMRGFPVNYIIRTGL